MALYTGKVAAMKQIIHVARFYIFYFRSFLSFDMGALHRAVVFPLMLFALIVASGDCFNTNGKKNKSNNGGEGPLSVSCPTAQVPGTINTAITQTFPSLQAIINKADPSIPVYGLYSWESYYEKGGVNNYQQEVQQVGWATVRIGGLYEYADSIPDSTMINIVNSGVEVLFTLMMKGTRRDTCSSDEDFIQKYIAFVDKKIGKYGPEDKNGTKGSFWTGHPSLPYRPVIYWEIWNEPNEHYMYALPSSWNSVTMTQKAALYAKLLVASYDYIKAKWPSVKVVGFSASGVSRNDMWAKESPGNIGFIEMVHQNIKTMYGNGKAANCYDILSDHPYVHCAPPDSEDIPSQWYHYSIANSHAGYREIMSRYGNGGKPVWFTEIGWHRNTGAFPASAQPFSVSERIQAAYVCRLYMTAMRLGVERVHVMFLLDADNFNGGFFNNQTRAWRESARAVQTMTRIMPNPKIAGAISDGADGYYAYRFESNCLAQSSPIIIAAWNVAGEKNVAIPCDSGDYIVTDMLGGTIETTNEGSGINIQIGPCPVFIKKK